MTKADKPGSGPNWTAGHDQTAHTGARVSPSGARYEIITPPNRVARKVTQDGVSLEEMERREAEVLVESAGSYHAALEEQVARLRELGRHLDTEVSEDQAAMLAEITRIGHDIKGQAPSFGYPLAGKIADTLNRLLQHPPRRDKLVPALRTYIDALSLLSHQDIRTIEDPRGEKLYREFVTMAEKLQRE